MRKFVSVGLAFLILMNTMGYYLVFMGLKYRNTQTLTQRLDDQEFDPSETIVIELPIALPYSSNTKTEFQRIEGEIEYKGNFYQLIKQRFLNDTLQLVCIRDHGSKKIAQALTDYVKTFTNHASPNKEVKTVPAFIKDYILNSFDISRSSKGYNTDILNSTLVLPFDAVQIDIPAPPPET